MADPFTWAIVALSTVIVGGGALAWSREKSKANKAKKNDIFTLPIFGKVHRSTLVYSGVVAVVLLGFFMAFHASD